MIRNLILSAVTATVIGFGGQMATAGEPVRGPIGGPVSGFHPPQGHDHDFVVYVWHRGHWDRHGRYETRREAERVERWLERQGHRVRIEEIHDRRPRY